MKIRHVLMVIAAILVLTACAARAGEEEVKIKGKPLSLKTQMISTMVGLAAIVLIGLYVTIQDIGRFF